MNPGRGTVKKFIVLRHVSMLLIVRIYGLGNLLDVYHLLQRGTFVQHPPNLVVN